jgi:hypothetical protein
MPNISSNGLSLIKFQNGRHSTITGVDTVCNTSHLHSSQTFITSLKKNIWSCLDVFPFTVYPGEEGVPANEGTFHMKGHFT